MGHDGRGLGSGNGNGLQGVFPFSAELVDGVLDGSLHDGASVVGARVCSAEGAGEGEAGPDGGPPGDLFVQMSVKQHPIFERDGKNLYCEMPITFVDAALGGELEVPTLNGRVKLRIPAETQTGKLFRLRGKGVKPVRGGGVGDLLCRVVLETPVKLNKKQKALLEQLKETLGEGGKSQSPRQNSWFEGVKSFFDDMKI